MRPTKLTIYILIILGIIGVILLANSLLKYDDSNSSNDGDDSSKDVGQSAYPGVDIITEVTDEATYIMAIHYPEFKNSSINKEIEEYVSKSKQEFLDEVEVNKEQLQEMPASLYILLDIYPVGEDVYSFVLNRESYIVGANGYQSSTILMVDIDKERFIPQTGIL
ncbi:hypothetical protein [Ornithinibacillus californiensis]|uniref:hypothetical protein n=1 Tax=Ornithinibacillus californiensis TaxID=161536 RepID=UPI00064E0A59|nr:hypothetical protein [Ornithinibacillus californiensis]